MNVFYKRIILEKNSSWFRIHPTMLFATRIFLISWGFLASFAQWDFEIVNNSKRHKVRLENRENLEYENIIKWGNVWI